MNDATTKPVLQVDSIPMALRDRDQWVVWRREERTNSRGERRVTKVPYNPRTGVLASTDNRDTWSSFTTAVQAVNRYDGLGFVFSADDPFYGVDFDGSYNPETGELDEENQGILTGLQTYAEVTPSNFGVHAIGIGTLPGKGRHPNSIKMEMYDQKRFFTVTGLKLANCPSEPQEPLSGAIQCLYDYLSPRERVLPGAEEPHGPALHNVYELPVADDDLIRRAKASKNGALFAALWAGDTSAHGGDASSADLALCNYLAFWCNGDAGRIDKLFRQSGLMRAKWDSKRDGSTWGRDTIDLAIAGMREGFSASQSVTLDAPEVVQQGVALDEEGDYPYIPAYTMAELRSFPKPGEMISGWLLDSPLSVLYAESGAGKSFLALDWGMCIASGIPWHGHGIENGGPVLYIAAEGGSGMYSRASAWCQEFNGGEDIDTIRFVTNPVYPTIPETIAAIQGTIKRYRMFSTKLIIVDTLARCFGDGDENKSQDMGKFIMALDRWHMETGANILLVHHAGWQGDHMRGSSSLRAGADSSIRMKWDKEAGVMTVEAEKLKDLPDPAPKRFVRKKVDDSLVLAEELAVAAIQHMALSDTMQKILLYLHTDDMRGATASELMAHVGIQKTQMNGILHDLRNGRCLTTSAPIPGRQHVHFITDYGAERIGKLPV